MGKPITIGQSHTAMSVLALNTDWDALDSETLQRVIDDPTGVGAQFTAFLKNRGRVIVGEPKIVPIDRTKPFNPQAGRSGRVPRTATDSRATRSRTSGVWRSRRWVSPTCASRRCWKVARRGWWARRSSSA
jgi:hypothetical protein